MISEAAWLTAGVLLERQIVFFCPHIGQLSTAVLSMIPLLRPFAWQSMLMPVLPAHDSMLHLLDAPVPFLLGMQVSWPDMVTCGLLACLSYATTRILLEPSVPQLQGGCLYMQQAQAQAPPGACAAGVPWTGQAMTLPSCVQYKTADAASRCSNLVRVNVYKDQVANTGRLPSLPGHPTLTARLAGPYWRLVNGYHRSQGKAIYAMPAPLLEAAAEFQHVRPRHAHARLRWPALRRLVPRAGTISSARSSCAPCGSSRVRTRSWPQGNFTQPTAATPISPCGACVHCIQACAVVSGHACERTSCQ